MNDMTTSVVGIDCGLTLRKYAWVRKDGSLATLSTREHEDNDILSSLHDDGVTHFARTGIGGDLPHDVLAEVTLDTAGVDPIDRELRLQSQGVNLLLLRGGKLPPRKVIVSIGTGTSYTIVGEKGPERVAIGNPIGGGFLAGMCRQMRIDFGRLDALAGLCGGMSDDLLFSHAMPETRGTPMGNMVLSHFANGEKEWNDSLHCASIINTLAVAVARDLLLLRQQRSDLPTDVVFIGTPVARLVSLQTTLGHHAHALGFRPFIPKDCEFAGAVGAMQAGLQIASSE